MITDEGQLIYFLIKNRAPHEETDEFFRGAGFETYGLFETFDIVFGDELKKFIVSEHNKYYHHVGKNVIRYTKIARTNV